MNHGTVRLTARGEERRGNVKVRLDVKPNMGYQKTMAIRDYLAFTLRSASTECIHKTMAIDRKTR